MATAVYRAVDGAIFTSKEEADAYEARLGISDFVFPENYDNPNRLWFVETEADEEGRTMRDLGLWKGHVADIAATLRDQCFFKLYFKPATLLETDGTESNRAAGDIHIGFAYNSKTWDLSPDARAAAVSNLFNGYNDCRVERGNQYASVKLVFPRTEKNEE